MSGLRDFLVEVSMDPELRDRFRRDPDAVFAAYALTESERTALKRPETAMSLIAEHTAGVQPPPEREDADPPAPSEPASAHAAFFLRIFPEVVTAPDGTLYVSHSGILDPTILAPARPIPWRQRMDHPETRAAADRVRESPPETRRERILALIQTLVQP